MDNYFEMNMPKREIDAISNIGLAHMGDCVYEILVRAHLCAQGRKTVQQLHQQTIQMVKATYQAKFVDKMLPILTEEELAYYRRARMPTPTVSSSPPPPPNTPRPPAWRPCSATCSCPDRKSGQMRFFRL